MSIAKRAPSKWIVGSGSVGWAALLDVALPVEWTFPYCNRQDDGAAHAVFGLIPYQRFSGVSSLVYEFQPALFVGNLLLLAVLVLATALVAQRCLPAIWLSRTAPWLAILGAFLLVPIAGYHGAMYQAGWWAPVRSLTPYAGSYCDYRPVGLSLARHHECTPSDFWFDL